MTVEVLLALRFIYTILLHEVVSPDVWYSIIRSLQDVFQHSRRMLFGSFCAKISLHTSG